MKSNEIKNVYVAAPWFNEEQSERERFIVRKLKEFGFKVFAPRDESLVKPDDNYKKRLEGFESNKNAICKCDLVVAVTNGKDMGTLFDTGYAHSHGKPIIYFAEGLEDGFNLMLAMSACGVVTSRKHFNKKISEFIVDLIHKKPYKYEGEIE